MKSHWTPEALERLGKISDHVLAEKGGITFSAVALKRRRLGIMPRFVCKRPKLRAIWGTTELGLLYYPDEEGARLMGHTIAEIKAKRAER